MNSNSGKELKKPKTNQSQYDRLVHLIKEKPDIARNVTSRPAEEISLCWQNISKELNLLGPPCRDTIGWKKVWSDYKTYIKKKVKANATATASAREIFTKQKSFTETEEMVIELITCKNPVRIVGTKSIDTQPSADGHISVSGSEDEHSIPEAQNAPVTTSRPKIKKTIPSTKLLRKQVQVQESTSRSIRGIENTLKRVSRSLDDLKEIEMKKLKIMEQHNAEMKEIAIQKLQLKAKMLETEIRRTGLMVEKSTW